MIRNALSRYSRSGARVMLPLSDDEDARPHTGGSRTPAASSAAELEIGTEESMHDEDDKRYAS